MEIIGEALNATPAASTGFHQMELFFTIYFSGPPQMANLFIHIEQGLNERVSLGLYCSNIVGLSIVLGLHCAHGLFLHLKAAILELRSPIKQIPLSPVSSYIARLSPAFISKPDFSAAVLT